MAGVRSIFFLFSPFTLDAFKDLDAFKRCLSSRGGLDVCWWMPCCLHPITMCVFVSVCVCVHEWMCVAEVTLVKWWNECKCRCTAESVFRGCSAYGAPAVRLRCVSVRASVCMFWPFPGQRSPASGSVCHSAGPPAGKCFGAVQNTFNTITSMSRPARGSPWGLRVGGEVKRLWWAGEARNGIELIFHLWLACCYVADISLQNVWQCSHFFTINLSLGK